MEFNEKLQELRKQKGLTQEELAQLLYVSRTAISKWESGRGYPNIESLKALAKVFSVTVDELLSSDEILSLAEEDKKQTKQRFKDMVFGLMDISASLLLFLPFFAQRADEAVKAVSILTADRLQPYLKITYLSLIVMSTLLGILLLVIQDTPRALWASIKIKASVTVSSASVIVLILGLQPYAAVFALVLLTVKALVMLKR